MRGDGVPTYALTLIPPPHPPTFAFRRFSSRKNNKQRLRFNNIRSIVIMITISSIFTTIETNYYNNKHIVTETLH